MTIKPIDIQTNIAHMHDIAKTEQARSAAYIEGQHSLEKNAEEEARRIRNKLEENKHAEKTAIMREENPKQRKERKFRSVQSDDERVDEENQDLPKPDNIGLKIDVKR